MNIGYIRVSTIEQNVERQLQAFEPFNIDPQHIFIDKLSGRDKNRPKLDEAIRFIRAGETMYVKSVCRLARNYGDCIDIVRQINAKGASVHFINQNITINGKNDDMASKIVFAVFGIVAEDELTWMKERQREGIDIAREKGVYTGRKRKLQSIQEQVLAMRMKAGENISQLAREFGLTRQACYKIRDRVELKK